MSHIINYNTELGSIIKTERLKAHYDQAQFGELLGVSSNTVSRWENGVNKISGENLFRICNVLSLDVDHIRLLATERSAQAIQDNIQNFASEGVLRIPLYKNMSCDKLFTNEGLDSFISITSFGLDDSSRYFGMVNQYKTLNFNIGDILLFESSDRYKEGDIICGCVNNKPFALPSFLADELGCKCLGVLRRLLKVY